MEIRKEDTGTKATVEIKILKLENDVEILAIVKGCDKSDTKIRDKNLETFCLEKGLSRTVDSV